MVSHEFCERIAASKDLRLLLRLQITVNGSVRNRGIHNLYYAQFTYKKTDENNAHICSQMIAGKLPGAFVGIC